MRSFPVFPPATIASVPPFPSPSFSGATPPLCRAASTFVTSLFLFKLLLCLCPRPHLGSQTGPSRVEASSYSTPPRCVRSPASIRRRENMLMASVIAPETPPRSDNPAELFAPEVQARTPFTQPPTSLVPLNPPTSPVLEQDFVNLPNNFFEPPLSFSDTFDGSISPTGLDSGHDLDFFNSPVKPMAPGSAYLMTSSLWETLDPSQPGAISVEDEDMDLEPSHSNDDTAQSNAEEDEAEVDELESSQQLHLWDRLRVAHRRQPSLALRIWHPGRAGGGKITPTANADSEAQEAVVRRQKNSAPPIPFATFAAAVGWKGLVEISKALSLFGEGGSSSAFRDKVLDGGGGSSSALGSRFTSAFGAGEQRNLALEEVPSKPTWGPLGVGRKLKQPSLMSNSKRNKKKKPTPTPPALSMGPPPLSNGLVSALASHPTASAPKALADVLGKEGFQTILLPPPPPTRLPTSLTAIENDEAASTNVLDFSFSHEDTTELDSPSPPSPPSLPSPPAPPLHSSPPSRASSPLSPLPNDNTNFGYTSDDTDDIALNAIDVGGRPSSAVEAELSRAFEEIETILEQTAAATGLTGKRHGATTIGPELHLPPPPDKEPAVLSGPEAKLAWDAFKVKYPPVVAQEILMQDNILLGMDMSQTHMGRKALFGRVAKKLHFELQTEYRVNKYQGLLLLVGSHVNEDGALGQVLGTGGFGSNEFFDSIKMSRNDLLGFAKVAAYQENAATFASDDIKDVPKPVGTEKPRHKVKSEVTEADIKTAAKARNLKATLASREDIGKDVFTELVPKNHFVWGSLREVLTGNSYRIVGWPADVRLPFQFPSTKASSGLWEGECTSLVAAVEARGVEGQGFRLEPWTYNPGNYVIYTHDYTQDTPDGAASDLRVRKHWRSSSAVALPVMDGEGKMWGAQYDLDGASVPQKRYHVEPFPQKAPKSSTAKSKGKRKAKMAVSSSSEVESEEEEEEMLAPALRTMKGPSAAPAPAKRRPKAASEAQKMAPPEAPATRVCARKMQEGGGVPPARSGPSTNLKSALRRPNAGERKRKGVIGMEKKRVCITVNDSQDDAPPANKEPTTSRPKPTKTYGKCPAQEHAATPPPRRLMSHVAVPQVVGGPSQAQMNSQPAASSSSLAVPPPAPPVPPAPPAPPAPQNLADLMASLGFTAEGLLQLAAIMKGQRPAR
ncbi:hypothetical protein DFH09DRAFT_1440813 [Mycena vulgaris]|nr:hypothetical protein DFH09DRAFT_1440813 [Mycena vulgaris]